MKRRKPVSTGIKAKRWKTPLEICFFPKRSPKRYALQGKGMRNSLRLFHAFDNGRCVEFPCFRQYQVQFPDFLYFHGSLDQCIGQGMPSGSFCLIEEMKMVPGPAGAFLHDWGSNPHQSSQYGFKFKNRLLRQNCFQGGIRFVLARHAPRFYIRKFTLNPDEKIMGGGRQFRFQKCS